MNVSWKEHKQNEYCGRRETRCGGDTYKHESIYSVGDQHIKPRCRTEIGKRAFSYAGMSLNGTIFHRYSTVLGNTLSPAAR